MRLDWLAQNKHNADDFPEGFYARSSGVKEAMFVSELSAQELSQFFRNSPEVAERILTESYDKRYSPASFIREESYGFSGGWYSERGYECVREFTNLADAATDYLLFTLGKGRWIDSER